MKNGIKSKCLKALQKTMLEKYYSPYQFCIGGYSEECICLVEEDSRWIISRVERGQIEKIGEYNNLMDGCLAYIEANSINEKEVQELKDIFLTNLFLPEDNNTPSPKTVAI